MEYLISFVVIVIIFIIIVSAMIKGGSAVKPAVESIKTEASTYVYARKGAVMTAAEAAFYHRLLSVAGDRYYVFPQIHLSALLTNQTKGRYWKAAFQRINRTSVDYVLCDKQTMRAVYAVELDDSTHDTAKRRASDAGVEKMFADVDLPLVRFRDAASVTDDAIAERFYLAAHH